MGRADTYNQPEAPDPVLSDELVVQLASEYLGSSNLRGNDTILS